MGAQGLMDAVFEPRKVVQLVTAPPGLVITVSGGGPVQAGMRTVVAIALLSDGSVRYVVASGGSTPVVIE